MTTVTNIMNILKMTALIIDQEIRKIIDESYERAKNELIKHQDKLKLLADKLLEKEIMEIEEIRELTGFKAEEKKEG